MRALSLVLVAVAVVGVWAVVAAGVETLGTNAQCGRERYL